MPAPCIDDVKCASFHVRLKSSKCRLGRGEREPTQVLLVGVEVLIRLDDSARGLLIRDLVFQQFPVLASDVRCSVVREDGRPPCTHAAIVPSAGPLGNAGSPLANGPSRSSRTTYADRELALLLDPRDTQKARGNDASVRSLVQQSRHPLAPV